MPVVAVVICLLLMSTGYGAGAVNSGNRIKYGDFETAKPCGRPAGWTPLDYGWELESAGNLFFVSRDAFSGNGSAAIVLNTFENGWSATPLKNLKPDTWYCLSARAKTALDKMFGNGPTIFVFRHLPGENRMGTNPDKFFGTYAMGRAPEEWELMKLAFKTPEETGHMYAGIGLYHALGTALFDDLRVDEINEDDALQIQKDFISYNDRKDLLKSKNFVVNSSFEIVTAPHMPDGWAHGMHYAGWKRDFYESIRVVEDNPFHGERCLKIKDGSLRYCGSPTGKIDKTSVVSFYLRTDVPGSEFKVSGKTFKPGREWQRYAVELPEGSIPRFWVEAKGPLYLDAVQMESGEIPSDYAPNHRDNLLSAPLPQVPESPSVNIGMAVNAGGKIPWNKGIAAGSFRTDSGSPAKKATRAFIVKGEDALHIRFECHDRRYENMVKNIRQRDSSSLADDSVAVTVNTGFKNGQDRPFVFEVNAAGIQRDAFGVDARWDAEWQSITGKLRDGYWVEFTIPYAAFNHDFATDTWQVNLIRYSAARDDEQREISAWFNPGVFPVEFTGMQVSGFTDLAQYRVKVGGARVVLCGTGSAFRPMNLYNVAFSIGCASGNSHGTAVFSLPSGIKKEMSWQTEGGIALLSFGPFKDAEVMDIKDFTLTVLKDGRPVAVRKFWNRLRIQPVLSVGHLDRTYYTNEKTAGLRVDVNACPSLSERLEMDVSITGQMNRIFHKRYPAESSIIEIPLPADLSPGDYIVKVNLVSGNQGASIFASGETSLTKLAPSAMETKVNPITRMLVVNGKEYIQHGLSVSAATNTRENLNRRLEYLPLDIDEIAKRFTGITPLYATLDKDREYTVPVLKDLVEKFYRAGLDVTMSIPSIAKSAAFDPGDRFFDDRFDALKQYGMKEWPVIAWYQFDEAYGWWEKTAGNKESDLLDFYWQLKEFDPYRVFNTDTCHCGRVYGGLYHADWIGGSYYPISFYPPMNLVSGIRGFAMATEKTRSAVDARVVTGGFLPCFAYERGREPSAREYRAAVYLMMINGCRAANLWMYSVFSQELWDSMIPLKEELSFLSRIFSEGRDISPLVSVSNSFVDFTAWQYHGRVYLITASFTPEGVTAAFDLKLIKHSGRSVEVFENRNMKIDSGILTDIFEGFACRVYEIQ